MGHLRATDLYAVGSFDPDHDAVMRIGEEAPGGGSILLVGISVPCSNTACRHLGLSIRHATEKRARVPNGAEWYPRSGEPSHRWT